MDEDDSVAAIRELEEANKSLVRESNNARAKFQEKGQQKRLASELQKIKDKYTPKIQELSKRLGLDLDQDQALERVIAKMDGSLPFKLMSELQKGKVISDGITRAVDGVSPDRISSGLAARDRTFIDQIFEGTGLGRKFGHFWTNLVMWAAREPGLPETTTD